MTGYLLLLQLKDDKAKNLLKIYLDKRKEEDMIYFKMNKANFDKSCSG